MSRLLTAGDYQRELGTLKGMIAEEERLRDELGPDPAAEIAIASMRDRFSGLEAELHSLGRAKAVTHEVALIFEGRPVRDHTVDATFLSEALSRFQRVLEAMLASASGLKSRMASLPKSIQKRSALRVSAAFPGSFGLLLETPEEQPTLFNDPAAIDHSLEGLVRLLQGMDEVDQLLEALEPLNARARTRYMELLEYLAESGADIRLEWPTPRGVRRSQLRSGEAKKLRERLSSVSEAETINTYRGTLDGALKYKGLFEFKSEKGDVFSGRLGPGVLVQLKEFHYEEPCEATITTRVVIDEATGTERVFYRLERLRSLEQHEGDLLS